MERTCTWASDAAHVTKPPDSGLSASEHRAINIDTKLALWKRRAEEMWVSLPNLSVLSRGSTGLRGSYLNLKILSRPTQRRCTDTLRGGGGTEQAENDVDQNEAEPEAPAPMPRSFSCGSGTYPHAAERGPERTQEGRWGDAVRSTSSSAPSPGRRMSCLMIRRKRRRGRTWRRKSWQRRKVDCEKGDPKCKKGERYGLEEDSEERARIDCGEPKPRKLIVKLQGLQDIYIQLKRVEYPVQRLHTRSS